MLTWFNIISFNSLSIIVTVIGIIVTIINTFLTCMSFERGGYMISVFVTVGQGVYGVTIQTVNNYDHVVSIEVQEYHTPEVRILNTPPTKSHVKMALLIYSVL